MTVKSVAAIPQDDNPFLADDVVAEENVAGTSVRQSAAQRRWEAGTPATAAHIQEALFCSEDAAQAIEKLQTIRTDAKSRKGTKGSLMVPFHARLGHQNWQTTCIQFLNPHPDGKIEITAEPDFMGAKEHHVTSRIQESALLQLPFCSADTRDKQKIILHVGPIEDGLGLYAATGIETYCLASSRLPFHLAQKFAQSHVKRILIHGSDSEIKDVQKILASAGYHQRMVMLSAQYVTINQDAGERESNPDAPDAETAEREPDPEAETANTEQPEQHRFKAPIIWQMFAMDGPKAVQAHLIQEAKVIFKPFKERKEDMDRATKASRATMQNIKDTGAPMPEDEQAFADLDEANAFLEAELPNSMDAHHVTGVVATTGLGKTRAMLRLMLLSRYPFVYAAPNNDLVQEIKMDLQQMQMDLLHKGILKRPRSIAVHKPRDDENCQRMKIIRILAEENRAPYAQACKISDLSSGTYGDCPFATECKERGFLKILNDEMYAEILLTVHQAISTESSMLKFIDETDEHPQTIERLIVSDEHVDVAKKIYVDLQDVNRNVQVNRHFLQKGLPFFTRLAEKADIETDVREAGREAHTFYRDLWASCVNNLLAEFARHADPDVDRSPHPVGISGPWADFFKLFPMRPDWMDQADGALLPERPWFPADKEEDWMVPKLWMKALYTALKEDLGVFFFEGQLIIGKESGLFNLLLKHGGAHMDATMPDHEQQIIQQFKDKFGHTGNITSVKVLQPHLDLVQVLDGVKHGKASLRSGASTDPKKDSHKFHELRKFLSSWAKYLAQSGHGQTAVLTHQKLHNLLMAIFSNDAEREQCIWSRYPEEKQDIYAGRFERFREREAKMIRDCLVDLGLDRLSPKARREKYDIDMSDIAMLGHWQQDDRGHNRWANATSLIIWGSPMKTPQEYLIDYHIHRAVMKKHGIEWAEWDGSTGRHQVIQTNGGATEITCSYPLPTVPDARRFVLSQINQQIAQGIGRLRGVRRTADNPATVFMYVGDFPVNAVEAGDYHLPRVQYKAQRESHAMTLTTREIAVQEAIASHDDDVRPCLSVIVQEANIIHQRLNLNNDKILKAIGMDYARDMTRCIGEFGRKQGKSLVQAARELTRQVAEWALSMPGFLDNPQKPLYEDPVAWAKLKSHDADWRMAVAYLAEVFRQHDPSVDLAMRGAGRSYIQVRHKTIFQASWPDGHVSPA